MELNQINNMSSDYKSISAISSNQSKDGAIREISQELTTKQASAGAKVNDNEMEQKQDFKRIQNAVDKANDQMKKAATKCEFSYHEGTDRVSIKVYDKDTDEVIREIPPEESLDMLEKLWEIAGLFVDETR